MLRNIKHTVQLRPLSGCPFWASPCGSLLHLKLSITRLISSSWNLLLYLLSLLCSLSLSLSLITTTLLSCIETLVAFLTSVLAYSCLLSFLQVSNCIPLKQATNMAYPDNFRILLMPCRNLNLFTKNIYFDELLDVMIFLYRRCQNEFA